MKIGIDTRIYPTGIWRYNINLIKELATVASEDDEFVLFLSREGYDALEVPDQRFTKVLADYPVYSFAEQFIFPFVLLKHNCDLIHFTNFNAPILWPFRFVLTIHDLIHQSHSTFGSTTRNYAYYMFKKTVYTVVIRWLAWRAFRIIVPSLATKDDVVRSLKASESKIRLTYEGMDTDLLENEASDNSTDILQKYNITKPYLLYVATMYPHKNHQTLIKAFLEMKSEMPDLQLVLVGKVDHFSRKMRTYIEEQGIEDVVLPNFQCDDGYVPDKDLKAIYNHADAYVFPSLKEGFGIPILEAQSYDLPVLASRINCLEEIGGDSVLYFDPHDINNMKEQIKKVLTHPGVADDLVKKGRENITRFSWGKMARETYQVYQEARGR